jgi:hypothetical protein
LLQSSDYAQLYEIISAYLAEGYAVLYSAEADPDSALERMARAGIETDKYLEKGTLKVTSSDSICISDNEKGLDAIKSVESWRNFVSKMMSDTKTKGVLAIGSTDIFIKEGKDECVIEYEQIVGKKLSNALTEAVCCYSADSLSNISVGTLIAILNFHRYTLHAGKRYSEWKDDKLQNVMSSAFNKVLGSTTSDLVLKTLKSVYQIDEKAIISNPSILENVVVKFFKDSSPAILGAILKDLKGEIAFHQPPTPAVTA